MLMIPQNLLFLFIRLLHHCHASIYILPNALITTMPLWLTKYNLISSVR